MKVAVSRICSLLGLQCVGARVIGSRSERESLCVGVAVNGSYSEWEL